MRVVFLVASLAFGSFFAINSCAQAQAMRTWVSGVGDDANPCSRTAPCRTFAGAISKTAARGEINALDPGDFGSVTITKSISIIAAGVQGGLSANGINGIVVAAGTTDSVLLDGLDIQGYGTGQSGVRVISGNRVIVRNCTIQGFTNYGVDFESNTPNSSILVERSLILGNSGGIFVQGSGVSTYDFVLTSTIGGNSSFNLSVNGPSVLAVSASSLVGPGQSIVTTAGGTVQSYGNNIIRGSTPTQTLPLQ